MANRNIITEGRTTIAIDQETKTIFDWSQEEQKSKTVTSHLRRLLIDEHKVKEWSELVKRAQNKTIICFQHNKPITMFCNHCHVPLCPDCDVKAHVDLGHDVLNFCRTHQTGYRSSCLLCEKERWEGIVDIPKITAAELKDELDKGTPLFIIDIRNKHEYDQGHLPKKFPCYHMDFKFMSLQWNDEFKKLHQVIEENKDKLIVVMSQSMPKKDKTPSGSARSFIASAQMRVMFKVKDVRYLDGGWSAFHYLYPDIVNKEHKTDDCRICRFYGRQ